MLSRPGACPRVSWNRVALETSSQCRHTKQQSDIFHISQLPRCNKVLHIKALASFESLKAKTTLWIHWTCLSKEFNFTFASSYLLTRYFFQPSKVQDTKGMGTGPKLALDISICPTRIDLSESVQSFIYLTSRLTNSLPVPDVYRFISLSIWQSAHHEICKVEIHKNMFCMVFSLSWCIKYCIFHNKLKCLPRSSKRCIYENISHHDEANTPSSTTLGAPYVFKTRHVVAFLTAVHKSVETHALVRCKTHTGMIYLLNSWWAHD